MPAVPEAESSFVVDFKTLFVAADWIAAHCVIPDGFRRGEPYAPADWQLWFLLNHYRIKPKATIGQLAPAFHYRRSQLVMPQKAGKGPLTAAQVCLEGVGPALFAGFARGGEIYDCRDHGCGCGWVYVYERGEAMGRPWPTPLIQITAFSADQAGNIYDALRPMIQHGPLEPVIPKTGEEFTRLPGGGRIDVVTSSALSRLGQRVTFVAQDETQLYTKANKMLGVAETQRRGAAGMGGRTVETTNAWNPAEQSVAQRTAEAKATDVFRYHRLPPAHLSYRNKVDRRKIHRHNYAGCWWVDLDAIEAEAAEILEHDLAQAERFFGNRIVASEDAYFDRNKYDACHVALLVEPGEKIAVGFDGSLNEDETWLRCCRIEDGYLFTPRFPDGTPMRWAKPDDRERRKTWQVPRGEVHAGVELIFSTYKVARAYVDPQHWQSELEAWRARWGDEVVLPFETWRTRQMSDALEQFDTDIRIGEVIHDGDPVVSVHIANATRYRRPGGVLIVKPSEDQKIDGAMSTTLAYVARADVIAAGPKEPASSSFSAY